MYKPYINKKAASPEFLREGANGNEKTMSNKLCFDKKGIVEATPLLDRN